MTLFWLGFSWLAGIAAGKSLRLTAAEWFGLAAIALAAVLIYRARSRLRLLFASLTFFSLGAARFCGLPTLGGPGHIAQYNESPTLITFEGVVVTPPDIRDTYIGLRVKAESVLLDAGQVTLPVHGLVLVQAPRYIEWAYGDRLIISGILVTPATGDTFSYRDYLARQGILSLVRRATIERVGRAGNPLLQPIFDLRARAHAVLIDLFPDPEASLLAGILLGAEGSIPPDVQEAFNRTGTSHIIAISGFNITIVSGLFLTTFARWLGRRRGVVAAALAITLYTVLVGASPSVVRAAIMGGLALSARQLGRQTHGLASLAASASLMTAIDPYVLWDVGFQLSFAATLGLILYASPLEDWIRLRLGAWVPARHAQGIGRAITQFGLYTLAAQATTLPLTIYYFQRLSLSSLLANPLILPAQPALMVLGGLAMILGSIWLPLGRPLAWAAWPFVAFTIRIVERLAAWDQASIPLGRVTLPFVVLLFLLLFAATGYARLPAERRPRAFVSLTSSVGRTAPAWALAAVFGTLSTLTWSAAASAPDGRLHLTVLDIGSGDATLVETPGGRFILVDGGSDPVALSDSLGRRLPLLHREIDWLVLAATHSQQVGGLAQGVERFHIRNALVAAPPGGGDYRAFVESLMDQGCPVVSARPGYTLDLGSGAALVIRDVGDDGAVLEIRYGRFQAILAPGLDRDLARELTQGPGVVPVTAVLLASGGDIAANPAEWLGLLRPRTVLISVEAGNARGLPSAETLANLQGSTVFRTDINGWIELTSDGERLWAEVERTAPRTEVRAD